MTWGANNVVTHACITHHISLSFINEVSTNYTNAASINSVQ